MTRLCQDLGWHFVYLDSLVLVPVLRRKAALIRFAAEKVLFKGHTPRTWQSCRNHILITLLAASLPLGSEDPKSLLSTSH